MRKLVLAILICFVISFPAHAGDNTIYFRIPVTDNNPTYLKAEWAIDYFDTTGEIWVMFNMAEQSGVNMMMGSRVATEAQAIELKTRWPMMLWYVQETDEYPNWWTPEPAAP